MKRLLLLLLFSVSSLALFAQEISSNASDTLRKDAINVFMDASSYIKQEIPYINYVRDKNVADLVIIRTYQRTGSGGVEYTYFIEGQFKFAGMGDTLRYTRQPDDTEDQSRSKSVRTLKMGLMKYVMTTPLAKYIDISFTEPLSEEVSSDQWNSWVFRASLGTYLSGRSTSNTKSIGSDLSASRITSDWKINIDLEYDRSITIYDYGDLQAENTRKSSSAGGNVVRSLNDHWSTGVGASVFSSIYSNYDLGIRVDPALEYNIFPYAESTRRAFRIYYTLGLRYSNYSDTTQFFKTEETLFKQRIVASFSTVQKWGRVNMYAGWSNYLHDFSLNNVALNFNIDFRITKGLSLDMFGNYSFIHDQISLRKGTASVEDVLLQQQELSTTFSYYFRIGLSYTFGSIYNNVVNPRLTGMFR